MTAWKATAALVTGASSGIGHAFARRLAAAGTDLLLTALPAEHDALTAIAADLAARAGVRAELVALDLSERDAPAQLQHRADALGFEPDMLVNSAGIGTPGRFAEGSLTQQLRMIHVNVEALVALTGLYLPRMVARRRGAIIHVGSTAALQPMPHFGVYAATKAFVQSFGEATWAEHRHDGVRVVTLCTGPVDTPFHERNGDSPAATGIRGRLKRRYLTPDMVVTGALEALERDRPTAVLRLPGVGLLYYPAAAAASLVPRRRRLIVSEHVTRWLVEQQR